MKESWRLYDYLRRWWRWLLLAPVFGVIDGVGYHSMQQHPVVFKATATVSIENPVSQGQQTPPVWANFNSDTWPTEQMAVADVVIGVDRIVGYPKAPVQVKDVRLGRAAAGSPWWKAAVLGSAISSLLVIGSIYILEDGRAYLQHRRPIGGSV